MILSPLCLPAQTLNIYLEIHRIHENWLIPLFIEFIEKEKTTELSSQICSAMHCLFN